MSIHLVPDGLAGQRIDSAAARMTGLSRSRIDDLIADGHVQLDGRGVTKSTRVNGGEMLEVTLPEPVASVPEAAAPALVEASGTDDSTGGGPGRRTHQPTARAMASASSPSR